MSWTAIVPLKAGAERKSRLIGHLSPDERVARSEAMCTRVAAAIGDCPAVRRAILLGPERPTGWTGEWRRDDGRGLNAELETVASACGGDILVLHADLPLLAAPDLDALLSTGEVALAPDRRGSGTNTLALRAGVRRSVLFGAGSFARFIESYPDAAVVRRVGLALDVDTADDLARAEVAGFRWR